MIFRYLVCMMLFYVAKSQTYNYYAGSTFVGSHHENFEFEILSTEQSELDCLNEKKLFDEWKVLHSKNYENFYEEHKRFRIFKENLNHIMSHNSQSEITFDLELNSMTDWTREEYTALLGKHVPTYETYFGLRPELSGDIKDEVDWVKEGKVSEVKNQGQCGSCWSFSTTGAIESLYAIQKGEMITLSEQQLVDCAGGSYQNNGCNGGLMDYAFRYVEDNGLVEESEYPYEARDGNCRIPDAPTYTIGGFVDVARNELALKKAVSSQPVSVAIEADQTAFQFYHSGVLSSSKCGDNLDHGVLVVGYGEEDGVMFWKIKNSWGSEWGDDGYIKIERTESKRSTGTCGIAMSASYPTLNNQVVDK